MGILVSFYDYVPPNRYDGIPFTHVLIDEADNELGPFTHIDDITLDHPDPDPSNPEPRNFSTENATLNPGVGWYRISWKSDDGVVVQTDPLFNAKSGTYELLASLDDINAQLDGDIIQATPNNTRLIQVSVARVVRAYLSRVIDAPTLASWTSPDSTPETIREVAGKMIAAQLYSNETARSSTLMPPTHAAQIMYNQAMEILNQIIEGDIDIPNVVLTPIEGLSDLDYFPVDATDRAFTMGMNL
jgi:hypothetical protein